MPAGTPTPTAAPTPPTLARIEAADEAWQRCRDNPEGAVGFPEVANLPPWLIARRAGAGWKPCAQSVFPSLFATRPLDTTDADIEAARRAVQAVDPALVAGWYAGEEQFPRWVYALATGAVKLTRDVEHTETVEVPVTRAIRRCSRGRCAIEHRPVKVCRFDRAMRRRVCDLKTRTETRTVTRSVQVPGIELPDPLALPEAGFVRHAALISEFCTERTCLLTPYLPSWTSDGRWDDTTTLLDTDAPTWADAWLRALRAHYPAARFRVAWQLSNCSRPAWSEARLRFLGAWLPVVNLANHFAPELQIEACRDRSFERPDGTIRYDFPPIADCAALAAAEQIPDTLVRVWPDVAASTVDFSQQLALCPPKRES